MSGCETGRATTSFNLNKARMAYHVLFSFHSLIDFVSIFPNAALTDQGPIHTATFSYEKGLKLLRFALRSHCSAVKKRAFSKTLMKTHKFENERQKRRHLKTLHIPLLIDF